jgi:hypothetical protein
MRSPALLGAVFDFKYDGLGFATLAFNNVSGLGQGGTGTLSVDGKVVATQTMERTIPLVLPWDETFDIGSDTGTPIDDRDSPLPQARSPSESPLTRLSDFQVGVLDARVPARLGDKAGGV